MIRFIASDLDGTLLQNTKHKLTPDIIRQIKELKKQGIIFAAASGRQYPNLTKLFHEVKDDLAFIASNGGIVVYQNELIAKHELERSTALNIANHISSLEGIDALLDGQHASYILKGNPSFLYHLRDNVKNVMIEVDRFEDIDEDIVKVSGRDTRGITYQHGENLLSQYQDIVSCALSGFEWIDLTSKESTKGNGVAALLDKLSINPSEAMAFGDHHNDLSMLTLVHHSYAMENGTDAAKEVSKYITTRPEVIIEKLLNHTLVL